MQPTHCRPNKATRRAKAVCMLCNPTLLGLVSARCESLTNHRCLEHCERCSRLSFQARRRRAPATDRRRGKMPLEGSFFLRSFVASDGVSPFLANRCFSRPPNFSNPANRRFLRPSLQRLFRAAAHPTRCVARARARQICLPAGSELFSSGGRPCSYAACTANGTTQFRRAVRSSSRASASPGCTCSMPAALKIGLTSLAPDNHCVPRPATALHIARLHKETSLAVPGQRATCSPPATQICAGTWDDLSPASPPRNPPSPPRDRFARNFLCH